MIKKRISVKTKKDLKQISDFNCGDPEISDYLLYVAYNDTLTRHCTTTIFVNEDDEILGFYSTKRGEIETDIYIGTDGEELDTPYVDKHPALEIYRFAVHQDYQRKHIGSQMMESLLNNAWEMNERMIYVESVLQAKEFYEKFGFTVLTDESKQQGKNKNLIFMYLDLFDIEEWEDSFRID